MLDDQRIGALKTRLDAWSAAAEALVLHLDELTPELVVPRVSIAEVVFKAPIHGVLDDPCSSERYRMLRTYRLCFSRALSLKTPSRRPC